MEAIIFVGIQATGKSSFYTAHFFRTHVRINLDMLRTRFREEILLQACIVARQPFVVDNTYPRAADRDRYIRPAKAAGFRVVGYYFQSTVRDAIRRNAGRPVAERIPLKGILGTYKQLQLPSREEGFDALLSVAIESDNRFVVREWPDTASAR
jgi:hypothetical protein